MQKSRTGTTESSDQLIRTTAKGGGIALTGNLIDKGLRFPLEMLLARVLGAGDYGSYSLGYGLAVIAGELSMLGLSNGIVRFGALYKGVGDMKRAKGILRSALFISTLSGVAAGVLLFIFSPFVSEMFNMPKLANVLRLFACAFPFYILTLMSGHAAGALQAIKCKTAVINICRPFANVLMVSIIFLFGFKLLGAVWGFLVSSAISAFLGLYLLKRIFPDMSSALKPTYEVGKLLRFSLPVLFVGFSHVLLGYTDRLMLGYFKASQELGVYSAAAVISQQASLITFSFGYIFCPMISDLYHRNELKDLDRLYKTVTRWIVSINVVILLLLIVFSKQIMGLFGPEFTSGGLVLVILSSVHLIGYSTGGALVGYMLRMTGKQDIELINSIVMLITNITLNLWLIPKYGILGAAISTGVSFALINVARILEVFVLLRIHPYDTNYHKPFVAAFVVIILSVFISMLNNSRPFWMLSIVALSIVYFVVLYFLGLEYEDKMILQTVRRRINNHYASIKACS
ncbi:MAG: flippase [Sedimentisphaerales bacterium]|nr:flippase [Sedimentisphaerales bacterium]